MPEPSSIRDMKKNMAEYKSMRDMKRRMGQMNGAGYWVTLAVLFGGIGTTLYYVAVKPFTETKEWQKIQLDSRKEIGVSREERQPGGMKVWSDPFQVQPK